jgi:hypothetical protein
MSEVAVPVVHADLQPSMTDEFMERAEPWLSGAIDLSYVRERYMADEQQVTTPHGEAVVYQPAEWDGSTILATPAHGQGLTPANATRYGMLLETVAPFSRLVWLHNGNAAKRNGDMTDEQAARVATGDFGGYAEGKLRILDELGVEGEVDGISQSLGTLVMGYMAGHATRWEAHVLSADSTPSGHESAKELQSKFLKSGGWGLQRAAMTEAGVPVLMEALPPLIMARDYAKFGVTALQRNSRALQSAMALADVPAIFGRALGNNPNAKLVLSNYEGDQVANPAAYGIDQMTPEQQARTHVFTMAEGPGNHKHSSVDNITAHALVAKRALDVAGRAA